MTRPHFLQLSAWVIDISPAPIVAGGEFQWLYSAAEEHCIPTLLLYHIFPIDGGSLDGYQGADFPPLTQLARLS